MCLARCYQHHARRTPTLDKRASAVDSLSPVVAVEQSKNAKTGDVSVTMVSQASCPDSCPLKRKGCYAENGFAGFATRRLNKSSETDAVRIARAEARAIARLSGRRDLRVHVVGDCRTERAARIVSRAMARHRAKQGKRAWTYTHAWRKVRRECWGSESVLASCETPAEVLEARAAGYATALVVSEFQQESAYDLDGVRVIPCPAQTRENVTCQSCGLCMDAGRLHKAGLTIAFEAHGSQAHKVRDAVAGRMELQLV